MSESRIIELAQSIAANVEAYEKQLQAHGVPTPSFDEDYPIGNPPSPEAGLAKLMVLDHIEELQALMVGGQGIVSDIRPFGELISLQCINRYGIAKLLPKGGTATYEELAKKSGLGEGLTRRLLRHAMTRRIFRERQPGVVEHTSASLLLAESEKMQDTITFLCDDFWPGITQTPNALDKWNQSEEPNHAGYNVAKNSDRVFWTDVNEDEGLARRFASTMDNFQLDPGFDLQHIVANYDWASVGGGTVVDIGGSNGAVMRAVCEKFPKIHAMVQDLPATVNKGPSKTPKELADRIQFIEHDFFTEQPVKGAEVYMFRWILHDWPDLYVVKILKALAPGMREHSKLLIWDALVPEPGQAPVYAENILRTLDVVMLASFNGREREAGDWPKILHDADPRYKLLSTKQPPGSNLGLVEVGWQP